MENLTSRQASQNWKEQLSGFLIIISPPDEIKTFINRLKSELYEKYGNYDGRFSKPHITICNFPLLEDRQEKVFTAFQKKMAAIDPFTVKLNNFDSFENSNVIYLKVEESTELNSLRESLAYLKVEAKLGNKFFLFNKPHITIGKKLDTDVFESSRSDFRLRTYQNSFIADRLKVLRYDFNESRYFEFIDLKLGEL